MTFDRKFFLNEHYELIECIWPIYNQIVLKGGQIPEDVLRHFDCRYSHGVLAFGTMDINPTWLVKEVLTTRRAS